MIGLKVYLEEEAGIFECISEPYVAKNSNNGVSTFFMIKDLHTNKVKEINVSCIDKTVSEQEYQRWNNG